MYGILHGGTDRKLRAESGAESSGGDAKTVGAGLRCRSLTVGAPPSRLSSDQPPEFQPTSTPNNIASTQPRLHPTSPPTSLDSKQTRLRSAAFLSKLPFDGYAIGGSLGRDHDDMIELLEFVMPLLADQRRPVNGTAAPPAHTSRPRPSHTPLTHATHSRPAPTPLTHALRPHPSPTPFTHAPHAHHNQIHLLGIGDERGVNAAVRMGCDTMDSSGRELVGRRRNTTTLIPKHNVTFSMPKQRPAEAPTQALSLG